MRKLLFAGDALILALPVQAETVRRSEIVRYHAHGAYETYDGKTVVICLPGANLSWSCQ